MVEERDNRNEKTTEKKRNTINNVIYVIKPTLLFENWFGIFRFSVVNGDVVTTSGIKKFIAMSITVFYTIFFGWSLQFPTAITGTGLLVDAIDEIPKLITLIQYVTNAIATSFFLGGSTVRIYKTFAKLDCLLHINTKEFYIKSRKRTIIILVLIVLCNIAFSTVDSLTDKEFSAVKSMGMSLDIEQHLETFIFCKLISMVNSRLAIINEYLTKFIQETNKRSSIFTVNKKDITGDKLNFIGRVSDSNMKIRDLAGLYDTIGEICCLINDVFKFQILMFLISAFTHIVITIWTAIYDSRTPDDDPGLLWTVSIWCFLTVMSLVVMSFTCEHLLSTRTKTKILVNEIVMDYDLPKTMRIQAKVFMELIDVWSLRIFVYDMFSVDIKLMLKFISVATTYLIVIIQISHFI